jgi:hypothetical protein
LSSFLCGDSSSSCCTPGVASIAASVAWWPSRKSPAATALHHDLTIVTRNVKYFAGLGADVFNPFEDRGPDTSPAIA